MDVLRVELRRFGESTSIRGIPRAIKSNDNLVKVLWSLSVVAGAAVLIWQVTVLLISYFKYDYTSSYQELKTKPTFPAVTVCGTYTVGNVGNQTVTWESYVQLMNAKVERWPFDSLKSARPDISDSSLSNATWGYLKTTTGYFTSLPVVTSVTPSATEGSADLLGACSLYDWFWTYNSSCLGKSVTERWNPNFYKCYTISPPRSQDIRAMSLILYFDVDSMNAIQFDASGNPSSSVSSGARIAVHSHDSEPDLHGGVTVGPGTEVDIKLYSTNRQRLNEPFANCTDRPYIGNSTTAYNFDRCINVCLQQQIIDQCNCVFGELSFTPSQLTAVQNRVCGRQTTNSGAFQTGPAVNDDLRGFDDIWCVLVKAEVNNEQCFSQCQMPCKETQYTIKSSFSKPWPSPAYQLAFFNDFIAGRSFPDTFLPYAEILYALNNRSITSQEAYKQVRRLKTIQSSFVQVNLVFNQLVGQRLVDRALYSSDAMLSLIGGTLSLWLGLTIIFVAELIELFYRIVSSCATRKRSSSSTNAETPNGTPTTRDTELNSPESGLATTASGDLKDGARQLNDSSKTSS